MKNQTILFVMSDQAPDKDITGLLDEAAAQNARVVCLILAMAPTYPIGAYGALPYGAMDVPSNWVEEVTSSREALKTRRDEVEALLQKAGVSGDVQAVHTVPADVRDVVARRALVCDVATVAASLRDENADVYRAATYGILFDSPIGLMLNGSPLARPKQIFLAWNAELSSARAIHTVLPMLKVAEEVHIAVFDPKTQAGDAGEDPGADLARWLSHHGCTVTVNQYPSGGGDIATALQRRASEVGADLVVMGAYGHSRMREFVFGGTTRTLLEQAETPVLMVH